MTEKAPPSSPFTDVDIPSLVGLEGSRLIEEKVEGIERDLNKAQWDFECLSTETRSDKKERLIKNIGEIIGSARKKVIELQTLLEPIRSAEEIAKEDCIIEWHNVIQNAKTLSELCEALNSFNAEFPGETDFWFAFYRDNALNFGGAEIEDYYGRSSDREGIMSWDENNVLLFRSDRFVIEPRGDRHATMSGAASRGSR